MKAWKTVVLRDELLNKIIYFVSVLRGMYKDNL